MVRSLWVSVAALLVGASSALAQTDAGQYPNQTVRIIVPFSAGSTTDGQARVIADKLSDMWKQQVIVENRPGIAGTASVARATADGYTLMLTSNGHTIASVINKNLPYDPVKDFAGITQVSTVPVGFVVPPEWIGKTLKDFIGARQGEARHAQFRVRRPGELVVSGRRNLQADRQDRHHAHSPQGRAGSLDQHSARRIPVVHHEREPGDRPLRDQEGRHPGGDPEGGGAARRADRRRGGLARVQLRLRGSAS